MCVISGSAHVIGLRRSLGHGVGNLESPAFQGLFGRGKLGGCAALGGLALICAASWTRYLS